MDTPGIFHIAIQLPGTLTRGPGSTTTWQDHRTVGAMDAAPQHAPPTLLRPDLLCQPQDHRQLAPSKCQAHRLRPRVSSSQHPNDQGRLPASPLRNYTDLSVSPPLLLSRASQRAVQCGSPTHPLLPPSASQQRSHFKTRCRAGGVAQ